MDLSYIKNYIDKEAIISKDGIFTNLGIIGGPVHKNILLYMDNPAFIRKLGNEENICLICNEDVCKVIGERKNISLCVVKNPKGVFYCLHNHLVEATSFYSRMSGKVISRTSHIDASAVIQDGVIIGERVLIEPNVTIYGNVIIGDDVIIRAGTVIGGEGFQFQKDGDAIIGIKHAGRVRICDHVEIQANCCIDKAVFDDETVIGEYSKLDSLVHIAHNVKIGNRCMLAAKAMVAGYVTIGSNVWVGPSAVISNRLEIANNARVSIGSVVIRNVLEGEEVFGNPAIRYK